MADVLPGYTYEPDTARYRNAQTGRFVSRSDINGLLRTTVQEAEDRLGNIATAFHEGRIAPASFAEQMRTELRRLELQNVALGKGGFDQLNFSDYGKVGNSLRQQYQAIAGTVQDVVDGKVSLPQLLNRIDGHVGEARRLYYETERNNRPPAPEGMTTVERRLLDSQANHCADCPGYYDQGWQPAGVLPSPGEACACRGHCRCSMEQRDVPTAELDQWIGTRR